MSDEDRSGGDGFALVSLLASLGLNAYQATELSTKNELAAQNKAYIDRLNDENLRLREEIARRLESDRRLKELFSRADLARRSCAVSAQNEREQREQLQRHLEARDRAYEALRGVRDQVLEQVNRLNADLAAERARVTQLQAQLQQLNGPSSTGAPGPT